MPTYTTTAKYLLRKLTGSNLISDIDAGFAALADDIDSKMVGYSSGPIGSRPVSTVGTPGIAGRRYRATDLTPPKEYTDTGTSWAQVDLAESGFAAVSATESTTSTSFTDLTTVGPSVTLTVPDLGGGAGVILFLAQATLEASANPSGHAEVAIYEDATYKGTILTGTNGVRLGGQLSVPGSMVGIQLAGFVATAPAGGMCALPTTSGAHTYKLRYRLVGSGTAPVGSRTLAVRALG